MIEMDASTELQAQGSALEACSALMRIKTQSVPLSRIFLVFEQDFVYKFLFSLRSLKIDPGPSNQATGFLELSNASAVICFSSFG
jgi:hypothetical protein